MNDIQGLQGRALAAPRSPAKLLFPILAVAFSSLFAAAYAARVNCMPAVLVATDHS